MEMNELQRVFGQQLATVTASENQIADAATLMAGLASSSQIKSVLEKYAKTSQERLGELDSWLHACHTPGRPVFAFTLKLNRIEAENDSAVRDSMLVFAFASMAGALGSAYHSLCELAAILELKEQSEAYRDMCDATQNAVRTLRIATSSEHLMEQRELNQTS